MKPLYTIILLLVLSIVTSCGRQQFSVEINAPEHAQTNKEISIQASVGNLSDKETTIEHAAHIFRLSITNSQGENIYNYIIPLPALRSVIAAGDKVTEDFPFTIETPGDYTVQATAVFDANGKKYELTTTKSTISVI